MNKALFKFTILTPLTFLPPDHPEAYDCPVTEQFAKVVADRVWDGLHRPIYTPSTAGEAFLNSDFDTFENRFLKNSEYAILVVAGQQAICLDLIYGRLLVFLTLRPTWRQRFILIYIGDPVGQSLFEPTIFETETLTFSESPGVWHTETKNWDKLLGILRTEAVIPPEDEQKTSEKRPFDRPESRDRKSVPTVATNEGVGEAPNQLPATNQSTDERAQLLVRGLSAVAQIALGGDNSSGVIFPEGQRHFESARTNFQASDHTPSSVRQEEQHQSQKPLQQVRSSSLDTLRLEIDNAKQVSENAKTPTLICKAQSIRTDYSSSQEFSGPTSFSRFTQRTGCVTYDESMCFISCRKRRAAPQNDIFSIPKAQGIGGEGEGQTYMDNVHRLFYRPRVRSAESFPIPPGSDVSEQSINSKKKRQRTFSDLFKSLRRKQKPKKKEVEEKLGSTIGVLAAFSAGMLHSDAQAARKLDEGKTGRENPVEKEVYLKSTCLQPETKSSTPLHQTLFVITSPAAESSAKASQASSSSVRRKARTDSGILSNYSLSSSEVNEFCVSPTLSSRSVNSSSFSSPKINSSNCTTGKSTISYPTQGQNTTLEPVTRSEAIKLYPYLLSTNRLAPVRSLETISIPDNNIGDFTQNSGNQTQGPITVETGIQETHFPAFVGEINYADSDWIQAYMVNSEPPLFDEGVKIGFLPGDMTGASSCTPNEKLFDPAMIMPVRENQQFQTAAVFSPLETDREPEAPTDKNEQLDCRQASEQLPCHQGLENLQDSQAKEQKFPDAVEQKIPFIMNPNSHTSLTPDSDDEQTLDEISDRVLISDPVFFQGNETAKRNPEYLNSVNSMGGTGTVGVILKEDKRPLTYVKPLEILGNNGLPSLSPDAVFISPTRESQTLIKNGPNTDRTNAQLLGATGTRIIEPPEIPWPKSESTCHNCSKPENSAVRDVQAEEIHCSPVATSLESAICPQLPPNITKKSLTDKSPTSPTHSDAQSAEESMSMTSSDQPIALSRPASEYDLQKATLYFTEHQRQSQDIAGITNATFPRKTAGKLSVIPRPSPKILQLVEQAFESYERFPSPGLPYLEEQSRVDEKRCVLLYGSEDSTDFNENPLQQTGRELTKPSRWSFFSSLLPYILVDVVNLSTAYIPRYLSCMYDWPRTAMHNPDKSLEMLLRFTQNFLFNNPFGIAGMFLCITLAAPRLQQVPFLLANCLSPQALTEAVTAVTRQPGAFFSERFCDLVAVFRVTPSWSAFAITGGRGLHWHLARPTI